MTVKVSKEPRGERTIRVTVRESSCEALQPYVPRLPDLEEAMRELRAWRERYGQLRALAGVFAAIDSVEEGG
jgi:hypothetical protein